MLLDVIRLLALRRPAKILDVGCGNGLFFAKLGQFGDVCGIEIDQSLIPSDSPYRNRISAEPLGHSRYRDLRFDLITALDVVEHIEDDRQAVDDMFAMLRPGGKLIVTVPASMMLWDRHDEINGHYRRYSRKTLRELVSGNGRVVCLKYLFHALFVPKLLVKTLNACFSRRVSQHGIPPKPVNSSMKTLCVLEYRLFGWLRIPFGTSLLAVIEKPADGDKNRGE
jgi:SAM-dependent methyltransferase